MLLRKAALTLGLIAALSPLTSMADTRTAQEEANLEVVLDFYEKGLNEKDADAALELVGDEYIQHNPVAADGREGFRQFIAYLSDKYPESKNHIKASFVDGDYVILHVHSQREPDARGSAIVDIFRLENGKIVEHWDAIQPIPEQQAHDNTMF